MGGWWLTQEAGEQAGGGRIGAAGGQAEVAGGWRMRPVWGKRREWGKPSSVKKNRMEEKKN
jgi:hypothetical protein